MTSTSLFLSHYTPSFVEGHELDEELDEDQVNSLENWV